MLNIVSDRFKIVFSLISFLNTYFQIENLFWSSTSRNHEYEWGKPSEYVLRFMHVILHNDHFWKLKSNGLESRRTLSPRTSAFFQAHPCTIVRLKLRPSSHLSSNHSATLQSRLWRRAVIGWKMSRRLELPVQRKECRCPWHKLKSPIGLGRRFIEAVYIH